MNKTYKTNGWWLVLAVAALPIASVARGGDAWISVEVVIDSQADPLSHREWMETLTSAGADNVRVQSGGGHQEPSLQNSGTPERPRYSLVGVVNDRGQLVLPGGRFDRRGVSKLRNYFERLSDDGKEGVTAQRGTFGLTEKQTKEVMDDLSTPLGFATKGTALGDVLKQADKITKLPLRMDDNIWTIVRQAEAVQDEVQPLTSGTALAILLKREGLVLVPTKPQGEPLCYQVLRDSVHKGESWPVGWKPNRSPGELAPAMAEEINAEIEGFTLQEAMQSIEPRIGLPVYWDVATMRAKEIDPQKVNIRLPSQKTRLSRVVDRILFQARLRGEVKVDEANTPFYWISR